MEMAKEPEYELSHDEIGNAMIPLCSAIEAYLDHFGLQFVMVVGSARRSEFMSMSTIPPENQLAVLENVVRSLKADAPEQTPIVLGVAGNG